MSKMINKTKIVYPLIITMVVFFISCKKHDHDINLNYIDGGYYKTVYLADSLFIEENFAESYNALDKLFDVFEPINLPRYYEFRTYTKSAYLVGEKEDAKRGLIRLAKEFGLEWSHINYDEVLKKIVEEFMITEENFTKFNNEYLYSINSDLRNRLIKMKESDQLYRGDQMKKHIQDSIDKANAEILKSIFEEYDFPNEKIVGRNGFPPNPDITAMILHTPDSIRKHYFLPKILQYIKTGKCKPELYALLIDQTLFKNGKTKLYGTFAGPKEQDSLFLNNNEVNKTREKIGMPKYGYNTWRREKLHSSMFN